MKKSPSAKRPVPPIVERGSPDAVQLRLPARRSLEERVNEAYLDLLLVQTVCIAADTGDVPLPVDPDELFAAIAQAAARASHAIDPIRHAPAAIANWDPDGKTTLDAVEAFLAGAK